LEQVLLERCELGVSKEFLRAAVRDTRFERLSGGRQPGQEDPAAHFRKGIAGDWRNYFTPRIKDAFKKRFDSLLISGGFETNRAW
jgi:lipopolysaccharide transport system ATP-binding protein